MDQFINDVKENGNCSLKMSYRKCKPSISMMSYREWKLLMSLREGKLFTGDVLQAVETSDGMQEKQVSSGLHFLGNDICIIVVIKGTKTMEYRDPNHF